MNKQLPFGSNLSKSILIRSAPFFIHPTFLDTWTFKALLIGLFFGLVYLGYFLRVRFLIRQKKGLENEVLARTKEQQLLIEDLEQTIRELEESKEELYQNNLFKEKLAIIIAHDLRSPLRFLFEGTRRLYYQALEKDDREIEDASIELLKATGNIYGFVDDFSCWLSTMGKNFEVNRMSVNVINHLRELEHFFHEQLQAKQNQIVFSGNEPVITNTDPQLLKIILRNIIDNANKHTRKGLIEIKLSKADRNWVVNIRDHGNGMTNYQLEQVRKRLEQKQTDPNQRHGGFGYQFIGDFSRLLNLEVTVNSWPGKGTEVHLANLEISEV
ncbi:MAG TPA: HAMP domain-containing sensor histidine kinase [Puia sp.]|nr:HAMP domain-containing sensor histidine kinase [Puia sp.]